jgi:hypothetical protein
VNMGLVLVPIELARERVVGRLLDPERAPTRGCLVGNPTREVAPCTLLVTDALSAAVLPCGTSLVG